MAAFRYSIFQLTNLILATLKAPIVRENRFTKHNITWQREATHLDNAF
jgi:hypothetical protein